MPGSDAVTPSRCFPEIELSLLWLLLNLGLDKGHYISEINRKNSVSSMNVRLAHMKSFFRYLMMSSPEYADQCNKILNIPFGKTEKKAS